MVLVVTTRSHNLGLVLPHEKEPWKSKIVEDWEKEEQLQKTFESIIQQMQALKATLETPLGSQPLI